MYEISASDDEKTLFTKRSKTFPHFEKRLRRSGGIHGKRHDGGVGFGIQVRERRPNRMVETPFDRFPISLSKGVVQFRDDIRIARCRIRDAGQRFWKAVKIVDGFRACGNVDEFSGHVPMGADERYGFGLFEPSSKLAERFDVRIALGRREGEHGRTVREKKDGHHVIFGYPAECRSR